MTKSKLAKREFLRGVITAISEGINNKDYTIDTLNKVYKKYRKENPELRKDLK